MKINSIYILILFCIFSINAFAEREAKTPKELELLEAVSKNSTSAANVLIDEGVAVDITDIYGQSLLMFAVSKNNKALVKLLIKKGADPNHIITIPKIPNKAQSNARMAFLRGMKVIDFGVNTNDTTMVDLLFELGAELDVKNKDLDSAIAKAALDNNIKMMTYLLKKGAKVSNSTGQFLVVHHILRKTYPFYLNNENTAYQKANFEQIKIWDDYGIPLDIKYLLKCRNSGLEEERNKEKVKNYMNAYREWVENRSVEPEPKPQERVVRVRTQPDEKFNVFMREAMAKEAEIQNRNLIIFFLSIFIFTICCIYRKKIAAFSKLLYSKLKISPTLNQPSINKLIQVRHEKPVRRKGENKNIAGKKIINRPTIYSSEKGWTVDDTKKIYVSYLIIEDVINPIKLANQHERNVREMIWYVRKMEKVSEEETSNISLHKKMVSDTLIAKWKLVNPKQVRSVYKRSLLIILANYSKQNSRVNQLIKQLKTKVK